MSSSSGAEAMFSKQKATKRGPSVISVRDIVTYSKTALNVHICKDTKCKSISRMYLKVIKMSLK